METKIIKITSKPQVKELLRVELDFKPRVNGSIIKLYGKSLVETVVSMLHKNKIDTEVSRVADDKYNIRVMNSLLSVQDNFLVFSDLIRKYDNVEKESM